MNNAQIQIEPKEILSLFAALSYKKQTKVYRDSLRKASSILVNATKAKIRTLGKIATRKDKKSGKSLVQGVKSRAVNAKEFKIHIMGEYRLKWFEKGTRARETRKGYNRGQMSERHYFFRDAKNEKESEIFNEMNNLISQSIQRIAKK